MKKCFKFIIILFATFSISLPAKAKDIPSSFADLAERVMPSVVNISTTTTVTTQANPFPFQFPQVLHLRICLKNLEHLKKENQVL